jgi:hypothetical protein
MGLLRSIYGSCDLIESQKNKKFNFFSGLLESLVLRNRWPSTETAECLSSPLFGRSFVSHCRSCVEVFTGTL